MTDRDAEQARHHRDEVVQAFRAAARLRLYSAWAAAFGIVVAIAVAGAMLIGWMSASDGVTWLSFALLTALVSAAKFYADATRTTVNAAGLERDLGTGDDLYAGTADYRKRTQRLMFGGVVVALLATGTLAVFSVANANTRTTDDDDDDDDTEQVDDDRTDDQDDNQDDDRNDNQGEKGDDGDDGDD